MLLVLGQAKNIHKQRVRTSDKLAMSQTSSGNPYSSDSIQEAIMIHFNLPVFLCNPWHDQDILENL